jgi:hypothetical protein
MKKDVIRSACQAFTLDAVLMPAAATCGALRPLVKKPAKGSK